ncbi:MAG: phosphoribosylformylglycinamidine cyclo-ligase [Alphaproteobacteria bacterium]|nr:phosphoribosylformylglycinamidine cyclo-ligase [Alphaproteobacteria bacterium]
MKGNAGEAYKQAGVDVDAGNALVEAIKPAAASSSRPGVMAGLGGFGAFFDPKAAGFKDPILVATTDGVGTKLKIAIDTGIHKGIGQDLVAMCVNDLVVQGAEPLFFLDYFATGKLDVAHAATVVNGIAAACQAVGCALIGGETAEMPGMYAKGDYDLGGFAVGAVERGQQITGETIKAGDVVLGLASSGVHSNGYSLVRKIVADSGVALEAPCPWDSQRTLADVLLEPTRLYVRPLINAIKNGATIKGMAHITGGGLLENIPRVLPKGLGVRLDAGKWRLLPVFQWMAKVAKLTATDLARTFNCGIGMVVIVNAADAQTIAKTLTDMGETVYAIGTVEAASGDERVIIDHCETHWKN